MIIEFLNINKHLYQNDKQSNINLNITKHLYQNDKQNKWNKQQSCLVPAS